MNWFIASKLPAAGVGFVVEGKWEEVVEVEGVCDLRVAGLACVLVLVVSGVLVGVVSEVLDLTGAG